QRPPRRIRGRQGGSAAQLLGGFARGQIVSGILCRRQRVGPSRPEGVQGACHLSRHGAIADRHRQSEIRPQWAAAAEGFMPAISPTSAADWLYNGYYKTEEEYLFAIADALREEYEAIVSAGFLLQVDDPHLVTYWIKAPDLTIEQCRKWAEVRVEALNHALRNIPPEKIRHHTCYGINMGPSIHALELKDIVDIILKIRAGAYSFEAANPRHEHEWRVWESAKLPPGKVLIPGVISHSTVLVEHPELVAERIGRYAKV